MRVHMNKERSPGIYNFNLFSRSDEIGVLDHAL